MTPQVEIVVPVYNEAAGARAQHPPPAPLPHRRLPVQLADRDRRQRQHRRHAGDRARDSRATLPRRRAPAARARRAAAARCAPPGRRADAQVVAYMDVDLSTDLRGLLPLVAPLLSGHSDLAIGTRLAHGARVVRGPKRELISRAYNRDPAHRPARALLRRPVRLQGRPARRAPAAARRRPRRGLVLRHRAARARAAARAADPRGAGRLGRRPRLARRRSCAPRSTTCAGVARLLAAGPVARFMGIGVLSTLAYALLFLALRPLLGRRRRERAGARADRGRQHRGEPPVHLRRPRARGPAAPSRARRRRVRAHARADERRARGPARARRRRPRAAARARRADRRDAAATVTRYVALRTWVFAGASRWVSKKRRMRPQASSADAPWKPTPTTRSSGAGGPRLWRLRKEWPAPGYSLTSCSTPARDSAASSLRRRPAQLAVPRAVARDDRAGAPAASRRACFGQHAVVRRGGVEAAGGGEQREAAAHAEADHADAAGAVRARAPPRRGPPRCPRSPCPRPSAASGTSPGCSATRPRV